MASQNTNWDGCEDAMIKEHGMKQAYGWLTLYTCTLTAKIEGLFTHFGIIISVAFVNTFNCPVTSYYGTCTSAN